MCAVSLSPNALTSGLIRALTVLEYEPLPAHPVGSPEKLAADRLRDAPAYGRCASCERQRVGRRRLRLLFPAQLELPTWQHVPVRRPILSTDATGLVVRRGTRRVAAWSLRFKLRRTQRSLYFPGYPDSG